MEQWIADRARVNISVVQSTLKKKKSRCNLLHLFSVRIDVHAMLHS